VRRTIAGQYRLSETLFSRNFRVPSAETAHAPRCDSPQAKEKILLANRALIEPYRPCRISNCNYISGLRNASFSSKCAFPRTPKLFHILSAQRGRRRRAARAKKSRDVLNFLAGWEPNAFGNKSPAIVKDQLLTGRKDLHASMLSEGALSEEEEWHLEYAYAIAASPQPRCREFVNIYDLVLYGLLRGFERADSPWIFRGQFNERFELVPSLFRRERRSDLLRSEGAAMFDLAARLLCSLDVGQPYEVPFALHEDIVAAWSVEGQGKLKAIRQQVDSPLVDSLSDFQQDAVIQHYLGGTPYLDFTKSICVAAFFATYSYDPAPSKGVVYVVSPNDLQEQLKSGKIVCIELPPAFDRPHRQKAVFVLTAWPELLCERSLFDIWTFHHTEVGLPFECVEYGVTSSLLLPDLSRRSTLSP